MDASESGDSFEDVTARFKERTLGVNPAKLAAQEKHERELASSAAAVTVDGTVRGIADLKVTIDASLETLSRALVEQTKKLAAIEESAAIRTRQLAELYDLEIAADSLATLLREHEEKTQLWEGERAAARSEFERERSETRATWDKERQSWIEATAADKARAKKEWQREQEEYDYALRTKRAREEEDYTQKRTALLSALADEKAKQERALGEREAAIAAREGELAGLQGRVRELEETWRVEVDKARIEATRVADDRASHEAELRAREVDGNQKLWAQRISTLEASLEEKNLRIGQLQEETRESSVKVRDIAIKAIEGASGATALSRVSEIALHQARGRGEERS